MRILLVNQYFWPEVAATAQLLADLAEDLAAAGFEVRVLTGRSPYLDGSGERLPSREEHRGVQIRRLPGTRFGRGNLVGRLMDYTTFLVAASTSVLFGPRTEVIVCLSTPPLLAIVGLLARWRGARFVYKVEDLYPDVAVALGVLGERSLVARILGALSRRLLRRADAVVALDEQMAAALSARGARHLQVIPNWADGDAIRPDTDAGAGFRRKHDLGDRFILLYSGNLGLAHRFDAICEATRVLESCCPEVLLLFVGGGPRLENVRQRTDGLTNVRFLPYQPREELCGLYNAADLHLICLRDEVTGLLSPSKYPAALAAGKPVLLVGGAQTPIAREIEALQIGSVCKHRSQAVCESLQGAHADRHNLKHSGDRARGLFEERYSRRQTVGQWRGLLQDLTNSTVAK